MWEEWEKVKKGYYTVPCSLSLANYKEVGSSRDVRRWKEIVCMIYNIKI